MEKEIELKCMLVIEDQHLALKKIALDERVSVQKLVNEILEKFLKQYEKLNK